MNPPLLCESCGYSVQGLPTERPCPECGVAIEASLPHRRTGSPWQARPSPTTWLKTNLLLLFRPRTTYRAMQVASSRSGLLIINLLVSGLLVGSVWTGVLIGDPARHARTQTGTGIFALSLVIQTAVIAAALWALTATEAVGLRFFGQRKGWRITWPVAWQVCSHASVGWIIAVLLSVIFHIAWLNVSFFGVGAWAERHLGATVHLIVAFGGFFLGLLVFETLAYTGVRQCRYSNAATEPRGGLSIQPETT